MTPHSIRSLGLPCLWALVSAPALMIFPGPATGQTSPNDPLPSAITSQPTTATAEAEFREEELLGPFPKDPNALAFQVRLSPDGLRIGWVNRSEDNAVAVIDGQASPRYDWIGRWETDLRVGDLFFSANSRHVAYTAKKGDKCRVVVDGQPGPEYDFIRDFIFNADGQHVAFVAESRRSNWGLVIRDGKEDGPYQKVEELNFSPDGQHLAYIVREGAHAYVVVDGHAGPRYRDVGRHVLSPRFETRELVFSPDSRHLAYAVLQDSKKWCVVDRKSVV